MMLTAMAIIHQKEIGLPSERVRLYQLVVDVLLRRWQARKVSERTLAPSPALAELFRDDLHLRRVVERLAYEAHRCAAGKSDLADLPRVQRSPCWKGGSISAAQDWHPSFWIMWTSGLGY